MGCRALKLFTFALIFIILTVSIVKSYDLPVINLEKSEEKTTVYFFDFFLNLFSKEEKKPTIQLLLPTVSSKSNLEIQNNSSVNVGSGSSLSSPGKRHTKAANVGSYLDSVIGVRVGDEDQANDDNYQDQVISREGINYILRDGEEYLLSPQADSYIEFYPSLPSSVCESEVLNIHVRGVATFSNYSLYLRCALSGEATIGYVVSLMEDDGVLGDDEVEWDTGVGHIYGPGCDSFSFEGDFENIYLSDFIIDDAGDYGEFYATVYSIGGDVDSMSTPNYDVYGYINGECECLNGACCDKSSRPYQIKNYGAQPNYFEDTYFCDGTNSPTSTSYVKFRDYYCDGVSVSYNLIDSTVDSCGTCEFCVPQISSCQFYSPDYYCGSRNCDSYDTACRNYQEVSNYCNGFGSCEQSTCDFYSNVPAGTPCGENSFCDGDGNCESDCECTSGRCCDGCCFCSSSHVCEEGYYTSWECPYGEGPENPGADLYFRQRDRYCTGEDPDCIGYIGGWGGLEFLEDCEQEEYCNSHFPSCRACNSHEYFFCYGEDVYWYDQCMNREELKEDCGSLSCYNGACGGVVCSQNSDCGADGFIGNNICEDGDIYDSYRIYTCNNPGTTSSFCSYEDVTQKAEECFLPGCIEHPDGNICIPYFECSTELDCFGEIDDWLGQEHCLDGDVHQDWNEFSCLPEGETSYCSLEIIRDKLKRNCEGGGCSDGVCLNPNREDGFLWVGNYNIAKIYQLSSDGEVLKTFDSFYGSPQAISFDGENFWVVSQKIYKMTPQGEEIESFELPDSTVTPIAIDWDGDYLWYSDYYTRNLYKLNSDAEIVGVYPDVFGNFHGFNWNGNSFLFTFSGGALTEFNSNFDRIGGARVSDFSSYFDMAWDGTYYWMLNRNDMKIYWVSDSGEKIYSFDSPGGITQGSIAWQPFSSCRSESYFDCNDGDLYWFDSCNRKEAIYQECVVNCSGGECIGSVFEQNLSVGWNQVYFLGVPEDNSVENVLDSIDGLYTNVWAYVDGVWISYSPTVMPEMNTLTEINPGMTINIEMNSEGTLSFVYY